MNKKEYSKLLNDYPSALNVKEVAAILRVSTKTVYKLLGEGVIHSVKVGRENRVAKADLVNYLRQKELAGSHPKCVVNENSPDNVWTCAGSYDIVRVGENKYLTRWKGVNTNVKHKKHASCKRTG